MNERQQVSKRWKDGFCLKYQTVQLEKQNANELNRVKWDSSETLPRRLIGVTQMMPYLSSEGAKLL